MDKFFTTWKCLELLRKGHSRLPSEKQSFMDIKCWKGDLNFAEILTQGRVEMISLTISGFCFYQGNVSLFLSMACV